MIEPVSRERKLTLSRALVVAVVAALALQAVLTFTNTVHWASTGELVDSDCYMRLQRVMNLHDRGHWFDSFEPRTNAPFGEQIHWTRPLDAILYALAWPLTAFTSFRGALWIAGMIVSPLLLVATLALFAWATRPMGKPRVFLIASLLLLVTPMFSAAFAIGRPDHHSLIALCQMGSFACLVRFFTGDERTKLGFVAGVFAGLGVWVSIESLAGQGLVGVTMALAWIVRGRGEAKWLARFSIALLATLAFALVIEYRPADWLHVRYARFTFAHVVLAFALAVPWNAIAIAPANRTLSRGARTSLAFAAGSITLVIVALTYPRFFRGPFADFTPFAIRWFSTVGESEPLWPTSRSHASEFVLHIWPALVGIAWCVFALRRGAVAVRPLAAALLLIQVCFLPLALSAVRWAVTLQLFAALPWALAIEEVIEWQPERRLGLRRALPVLALVGGNFVLAVLLAPASNRATSNPASARHRPCDWQAVSRAIAPRAASQPVLLTYILRGGQIIWNTPLSVVAAPYNNGDSLFDATTFFETADDDRARAIVTRRRVDLVLVCAGDVEARRYDVAGTTALHWRLTHGASPAWLEPVALPSPLDQSFRLFAVRP